MLLLKKGLNSMVKIPDIPTARRRVDTTAPSAVPSISEAGFAGRVLQEVGGLAAKTLEARETRRAVDFTTSQTADFTQKQMAIFEEAKQDTGELDNFTDLYIGQFDEERDKILNAAPNEEAKALSQERFDRLRTQFIGKALSFQSTETIKQQRVNLQQANDSLSSSAAISPESIPALLDVWRGDAAAAVSLGLVDRQEFSAAGRREIITNGISSSIFTDPAQAKKLLNRFQNQLTGDQVREMRGAIKAEERRIAAEDRRIAAEDRRIVRELDAVKAKLLKEQDATIKAEEKRLDAELKALRKQQKADLQAKQDELSSQVVQDPGQINKLLGQFDDAAADAEDLNIIKREELHTKGRRKIIMNGISSSVLSDTAQAKELLNTYRDELTGDQSLVLRKTIKAEEKRRATELKAVQQHDDNVTLVTGAMAGITVLDPKTRDHQNAVDDFLVDVEIEQDPQRFIDVAKQTGILPTKLKTSLNAMLVNGNSNQRIASANIIDNIHASRPRLVEQMSQKSKTVAHLINKFVNAGVSRESAIEWGNEAVAPADAQTRAFRQKKFRQLNTKGVDVTSLEQNDDAQDFFEEGPLGIFNQPAIPEALRVDYANIVENHFINNDIEIEDVQTLSARTLREAWKITEVGGEKRWAKNPPELAYAVYNDPERDAEWINEQLKEDILAHAAPKFNKAEIESINKHIFLEVNALQHQKQNHHRL